MQSTLIHLHNNQYQNYINTKHDDTTIDSLFNTSDPYQQSNKPTKISHQKQHNKK